MLYLLVVGQQWTHRVADASEQTNLIGDQPCANAKPKEEYSTNRYDAGNNRGQDVNLHILTELIT